MFSGRDALVAGFGVCLYIGLALAQDPPQQSHSGPKPPANAEFKQPLPFAPNAVSNVIATVPGYAWRHGCGPTAVGMVVGYYDRVGFSDLIPGDAATQTSAVNQAIASQGSGVRGSGVQKHYEDYSLPMDSGQPAPLADSSATYPTGCHIDNCIADFMHCSWSKDGNFYGWSWSNRIGPSFTSYVNLVNSSYTPTYTQYSMSSSLWTVLMTEINAGRPMVFLVDSDGNGGTDHFVTIVGYTDSPTQQYGCLDTWAPATQIRWCQFRGMSSSYAWGVWGGWKFMLQPVKAVSPSPANGAVDVANPVVLTWANGGGAYSYDVYLGTSPNLGSADFKGNQTATTFNAGSLGDLETYYWRIDVRAAGGGFAAGTVWSFQRAGPIIRGDFNNDGDVDQEDFGHMQACMQAEDVLLGLGCDDIDLTGDHRYQYDDFAIFQACFSGPNPATPGCGP